MVFVYISGQICRLTINNALYQCFACNLFNFIGLTNKIILRWQKYHRFTVKKKEHQFTTTTTVVPKGITLKAQTEYQELAENHFVHIVADYKPR